MSKIVYYNKNGGERKYLYDELEYLYNDSKAYFITDYYGKSNSRYELKIEPNNNNTSWQTFMTVGRPKETHTIGMALFFRNNGDFGYNWNGVTSDNAFNVGFGNPTIISYDVSDLYVNDVHRTNTASWNGVDTSPLAIMVLGNGNYDQYAYGKLYYFKVYEDDELVRDYIPIRSGNTIGLYDKVYKTITIPSYGSFKASENYTPIYSEVEKTIEVLDLYNDYELINKAYKGSNILIGKDEPQPIPQIPNDEIWYKTTDGLTAQTTNSTGIQSLNTMGLVSNTYEDGKGIMKFSKDVTSIGDRCFQDCTTIEEVILPDSVEELGINTFYNCTNLTSITFGVKLTYFDRAVFYNCYNLSNIYYNGTKDQFYDIYKGSSWRFGTPSTCIVHCTDGDYSIMYFVT